MSAAVSGDVRCVCAGVTHLSEPQIFFLLYRNPLIKPLEIPS